MKKTIALVGTIFVLVAIGAIVLSRGREITKYSMRVVAESEDLWTGVAVSKEGRIFVNYPRWATSPSVSVAELAGAGDCRPFPNASWNRWDSSLPPSDHFVCVQSVYVDDQDCLWILDPANAGLRGVVAGGAKLIKVDLRTNTPVQKILFDSTVAPVRSYLNDVRVDTKGQFAYLTDSGEGALVVVNLATGKARRVLHGHASTKAEDTDFVVEGIRMSPEIHSDGIALSPTKEYIYYQALRGRTLYRIATRWLMDESLTGGELGERVECVTRTGIADGIEFGRSGDLFLTSLELNALRKLTPEGRVDVVLQDSALKWPDAISIATNGDIYVTTSQLHLGASRRDPYRIFRISEE